MATSDLKIRIHSIIDQLPESALVDLLSLLEKIKDEEDLDLIREIIAEHRELLKKLAE